MIKLFEPTDTIFTSNGIKIIKPFSVKEHRELGDWYVEIELAVDNEIKQDYIVVVETKEKGYQPFRINNLIVKNKMNIKAFHVGFDSRRYGVELSTVVNSNCQAMLNGLNISPTSNFTFTSNITSNKSFSVADKNLYEALVEITDRWNGFLDFDNWQVSIKATIGMDRGVTAEYGKNIQESEITEDWDMVVTRLKPIGNEGITLSPTWLTADISYPVPYTKIMEFNTDTIENLELVSQLYLDRFKVPKVNYAVKINPEQNVGIGDSIFVKAKQFEIFAEVITYDYNVLTKRVEALEFGNYRPTVKSYFSTLKADIVQVANRRARIWIDELNGEISFTVDNLEGSIATNTAAIVINSNEISSKVSATYVDNKIAEINSATPNRVSNLPDNYEQGNITTGSDVPSLYHIRTRKFYPIASGFVTYQIADLYEAKIVLYDKDYAFIRDEVFSSVRTFTLATASFFKVVVKSKTTNLIVVDEIETSNLKVENES